MRSRPRALEIRVDGWGPKDSTPQAACADIIPAFQKTVDLTTAAGEVWVQMTRGTSDRLGLQPGTPVSVRVAGVPVADSAIV